MNHRSGVNGLLCMKSCALAIKRLHKKVRHVCNNVFLSKPSMHNDLSDRKVLGKKALGKNVLAMLPFCLKTAKQITLCGSTAAQVNMLKH